MRHSIHVTFLRQRPASSLATTPSPLKTSRRLLPDSNTVRPYEPDVPHTQPTTRVFQFREYSIHTSFSMRTSGTDMLYLTE